MDDLVFIVVKELRTPSGMLTALTGVEKLIFRAVKLVNALRRVANGV